MDPDAKQEATKRLATSLNLPPELAHPLPTGADTTPVMLDAALADFEDLTPTLNAIADRLTTEYLRPALIASDVADPGAFAIQLRMQPEA
jgi:hypothetical protein